MRVFRARQALPRLVEETCGTCREHGSTSASVDARLIGMLRADYAAAIQSVDLGGESLQSFAPAQPLSFLNRRPRVSRRPIG